MKAIKILVLRLPIRNGLSYLIVFIEHHRKGTPSLF